MRWHPETARAVRKVYLTAVANTMFFLGVGEIIAALTTSERYASFLAPYAMGKMMLAGVIKTFVWNRIPRR